MNIYLGSSRFFLSRLPIFLILHGMLIVLKAEKQVLHTTDSKTDTAIVSGRLVWLDSLRLIAGVSMVGLHATSDAMGQPFAQFDQADRILPMLVRAVIYTARTELFLIISVFLLLMALDNRPKTYRATIAVQARRLLIPFVF